MKRLVPFIYSNIAAELEARYHWILMGYSLVSGLGFPFNLVVAR